MPDITAAATLAMCIGLATTCALADGGGGQVDGRLRVADGGAGRVDADVVVGPEAEGPGRGAHLGRGPAASAPLMKAVLHDLAKASVSVIGP